MTIGVVTHSRVSSSSSLVALQARVHYALLAVVYHPIPTHPVDPTYGHVAPIYTRAHHAGPTFDLHPNELCVRSARRTYRNQL